MVGRLVWAWNTCRGKASSSGLRLTSMVASPSIMMGETVWATPFGSSTPTLPSTLSLCAPVTCSANRSSQDTSTSLGLCKRNDLTINVPNSVVDEPPSHRSSCADALQGSAGKFVEGEQRVAILDQALARPGLMSSC